MRLRSISFAILGLLALAGCGRTIAPVAPRTRVGTSASRALVGAAGPYASSQVIWWPASGSNAGQVENQYGLERETELGVALVCTVPPGSDPVAVSQLLAADGRVAWAEPNYLAETAESRGHSFAFDDGFPNLSSYEDQGAAERVHLGGAHGISRGAGVLIAVLDTGVQPEHPLLASHLVGGYDFVDGDFDPRESPDGVDSDGDGLVDEALGHGSHVSGIVALVAPDAKILPLRVLDDDGRGDALTIARAIDYARVRGARVINLSLGMLVESEIVGDAIARARADGIVLVASAGNWGAESPEEYPAENGMTMAVAATGADNRPTAFTSFGSHIALCAPGESIRSAYWNGHTAVWSGTSMSAPWVSGGAALLLSLHPAWTPDQVLTRLGTTATAIDPSIPEAAQDFGAGILDLGAALGSVVSDAGEPEPPVRRSRP